MINYIKNLKYEPLSRRKELMLVRAMCAGNSKARDALVKNHLRLVVSIAHRYKWSLKPMDDMIQDGNMGVIHACTLFDLNKRVRFNTYASKWIHSYIQYRIMREKYLIDVPVNIQKDLKKCLKARDELLTHDKPCKQKDIQRETGMNKQRVKFAMGAVTGVVSEDTPIGDNLVLKDTFASTYPSVEAIMEQEELTRVICASFDTLSSLDKYIAENRFGIGGRAILPVADVAEHTLMSTDRVYVHQRRIYGKLAPFLREHCT